MSDAGPERTPPGSAGEDGLDRGTGNPGQDRAHLLDEPPAQVDPAEGEDDAPGDTADDER